MSTKHIQRGEEARRSEPLRAAPEREMKFLVRQGSLAAVERSPILMDKSTRVFLKSVYFDTVNFQLHKAGISLRVRHVRGTFIQTVKRVTGLGLFDRDEWESEIADQRPDPSAWAETPVLNILGNKNVNMLVPVFSTSVQRTLRLFKEKTSLVEICFDQGELVAGDLCEPIEELELELNNGKVADLFIVARLLSADAILKLSFISKAERGYRLIGHERSTAQKAKIIAISTDMAADVAFAQVVRSCLVQVTANAELVCQARSGKALHQLRIGLRRLQTAFATFKPIFVNARPDRLKAETKWFMHELNPARDLDVFIANGFDWAKAGMKGDRILSAFNECLLLAQSKAYIRAVAALDSARFAALLLDCAEWVETRPRLSNNDPLLSGARHVSASVLATQALDRLRGQVRKNGKNLTTLEPVARHKLRIKVKQLHYTGEFFAETFGNATDKVHRRFISSLKALQDCLGLLRDMASARQTAAVVAGGSAEIAFRVALVIGARDRDESKLLAKAVRAYKRWHRVRPFWH